MPCSCQSNDVFALSVVSDFTCLCISNLVVLYTQVKRREGGWTPRPQPPSSGRMGSFGRKTYTRPSHGMNGRRQGPMTSDYDYSASRQNFGRRRPFDRGGQPGDFYGSYDNNAYPDYIQPYEYDDVRGMPLSRDRHLPYDDHGASSDDAGKDSDRGSHSQFSSPTTTVSASPGDD